MIKLKKILSEILNTFQIEVDLFTDPTFNVTDILNQIRAVRKITIVSIITPDDFTQKPNVEYQKLKIKFVTRGEPKQDLEATTTLRQAERSTAESEQTQQQYTVDNPYQIYIH